MHNPSLAGFVHSYIHIIVMCALKMSEFLSKWFTKNQFLAHFYLLQHLLGCLGYLREEKKCIGNVCEL